MEQALLWVLIFLLGCVRIRINVLIRHIRRRR